MDPVAVATARTSRPGHRRQAPAGAQGPGARARRGSTHSSRTSTTAATGLTSIRRYCSTTATSTGCCRWSGRCTRSTRSRRSCRSSSSGCCRRRGSTRRSASAASPSPRWSCCWTSGGCAGTWPRRASARWPPRSAAPREDLREFVRGSRAPGHRQADPRVGQPGGVPPPRPAPKWTSSPNGSAPSTTSTGPSATCRLPMSFDEFLMEEFLDGPEISVETLTFEGRHVVVAVTDKELADPGFVEVGHSQPSGMLGRDAARGHPVGDGLPRRSGAAQRSGSHRGQADLARPADRRVAQPRRRWPDQRAGRDRLRRRHGALRAGRQVRCWWSR